MARLIFTDGSIKHVEPKNGTDFQLEELKDFVGGYIEILHLRESNQLMVVNEEGKLLGLDFNLIASTVAQCCNACGQDDYIVGNVLICRKEEVK